MVFVKWPIRVICSVAAILGCLLVISYVLHTEWARVIFAMVVIVIYFIQRYR